MKIIYQPIKDLLLTLIFGVLYITLAFYNKFPLVTSDSGMYFNNIWNHEIPNDRPRFYSDFMKFFYYENHIYSIILVQSFLTIFTILMFLNLFQNIKNSILKKTIILSLLLLGTSVSWYVVQWMPDFFTPILLLSFIIILFTKNIFTAFLFCIIYLLSSIMHLSNPLSSLVLIFVLIILVLLKFLKNIPLKRLSIIFVLNLISIFIISYTQYKINHKWNPAPGGHVFFIGRMASEGILQEYLKDNCNTEKYSLCDVKNSIPRDFNKFVWEQGIVEKTDGWNDYSYQYRNIRKNILKTPKYQFQIFKFTFIETFELLGSINVGDGVWPYLEGTNMYWKAKEHLINTDFNIYVNSIQNQNLFYILKDIVNPIYYYFAIALIFITSFYIMFRKKISNIEINLFYIIIFYLIINSAICVFATGWTDRLNSRVFWVVILMCFSYFLNLKNKNHQKSLQ